MLKPKEILLADGVTYAPAFVSVNADGSINTGGGNVTVTNLTTLSTLSEQQNQTTVLTDLTVEAGKHTSNLSAIVNQTAGLATLAVQNNQTGILQTIANNTGSVNLTALSKEGTQLLIKSALVTDGAKVQAMPRVCLGTQMITALSPSVAASLTVPSGAVVAEIQADGGTVRLRRDAIAPTATQGWRLDDGMSLSVDCVLANVMLLAQSGSTTNVQIAYFDRV